MDFSVLVIFVGAELNLGCDLGLRFKLHMQSSLPSIHRLTCFLLHFLLWQRDSEFSLVRCLGHLRSFLGLEPLLLATGGHPCATKFNKNISD